MKDDKKMKKAVENVLQFGWMCGYPKYIEKKNWDVLHKFYEEELNNGKKFIPNKNNRLRA